MSSEQVWCVASAIVARSNCGQVAFLLYFKIFGCRCETTQTGGFVSKLIIQERGLIAMRLRMRFRVLLRETTLRVSLERAKIDCERGDDAATVRWCSIRPVAITSSFTAFTLVQRSYARLQWVKAVHSRAPCCYRYYEVFQVMRLVWPSPVTNDDSGNGTAASSSHSTALQQMVAVISRRGFEE